MSRRKFDRQFKISAVKLVQQSGYSRAEAANSLGVTTSHNGPDPQTPERSDACARGSQLFF